MSFTKAAVEFGRPLKTFSPSHSPFPPAHPLMADSTPILFISDMISDSLSRDPLKLNLTSSIVHPFPRSRFHRQAIRASLISTSAFTLFSVTRSRVFHVSSTYCRNILNTGSQTTLLFLSSFGPSRSQKYCIISFSSQSFRITGGFCVRSFVVV